MPQRLPLYNPSPFHRLGYVVAPWSHLGIAVPPGEFSLHLPSGREAPYQLDRPDPSDREQDVLILRLAEPVPPGPDDYASPSEWLLLDHKPQSMAGAPSPFLAQGAAGDAREITMSNSRFTVDLSLGAERLGGDGRPWYAGCATSVRFDELELLDAFRSASGLWTHDPEKRAMQVDQVFVASPPWEADGYRAVPLSSDEYSLLSRCTGQLRDTTVLVSRPFLYVFKNPIDRREYALSCHLCRQFSIFPELSQVDELAYVRASDPASGRVTALRFRLSYFSYFDMGFQPEVSWFESVPDWFAIRSSWAPYQGYGFGTNAHTMGVTCAGADYPYRPCAHRAFAWQTKAACEIRSSHLFLVGEQDIAARVGHHWYTSIFKPLRLGPVSDVPSGFKHQLRRE